jgi:hypothetical protein
MVFIRKNVNKTTRVFASPVFVLWVLYECLCQVCSVSGPDPDPIRIRIQCEFRVLMTKIEENYKIAINLSVGLHKDVQATGENMNFLYFFQVFYTSDQKYNNIAVPHVFYEYCIEKD